jgi:hypothetical protein
MKVWLARNISAIGSILDGAISLGQRQVYRRPPPLSYRILDAHVDRVQKKVSIWQTMCAVHNHRQFEAAAGRRLLKFIWPPFPHAFRKKKKRL